MATSEKVYGDQRNNLKYQWATVEDLQVVKEEIIAEIRRLLKSAQQKSEKRWMKTKEVRKMLDISQGTLQSIRVNGSLPYTKIGGVYYYDLEDIQSMLANKKIIRRDE